MRGVNIFSNLVLCFNAVYVCYVVVFRYFMSICP